MQVGLAALRSVAQGPLWILLPASGLCWLLLAAADTLAGPSFICTSTTADWRALMAARPGELLSPLASSILMIGAMMLPLLAAPLSHLHQRSLSQRRLRACVLFLATYFAVWLGVLALLGQAASWLAPRPGSAAPYALLAAAGIALCWQGMPAKRRFLNAGHVHPPLPAFGLAAEWGSLRFGASHAATCVGSCWALMLVPLASPQGHLALMGLVGAALLHERHGHPRPVAADGPMLLAGVCALAAASIWALAA